MSGGWKKVVASPAKRNSVEEKTMSLQRKGEKQSALFRASSKPLPPAPILQKEKEPLLEIKRLNSLEPDPLPPNYTPRYDLTFKNQKCAMKDTNRILWFLQNYPEVLMRSALTQHYVIAKPKKKTNSEQVKVWKGKQSIELRARGTYKNATNAAQENRDVFSPLWSEDHQVSFYQKKKQFIADSTDMVRLLPTSSATEAFERKWFALSLYGDFFALQCTLSGNFIGVNSSDQQLECKYKSIEPEVLFKLCVKGFLKSKASRCYIGVPIDSVVIDCTSLSPGTLQTLIIEIGGASCRIYSCSGISHKENRRYLSCWRDTHIEGTWHIGFPLYGHNKSELGSLVEEDFEILFHADNFFTLRACNDNYISCFDSHITLTNTLSDAALFELIPFSLKKKRNLITSTTLIKPLSTSASSIPYLVHFPGKENSRKSLESPEEEEATAVPSYQRSFQLFMENLPVINEGYEGISTSQYADDHLLFKEMILTQLHNLAETTEKQCFVGSLFLTNYRLLFVPVERKQREECLWSLPLGSLNSIITFGRLEFESSLGEACYAFKLIGKHWNQIDVAQKRIVSADHFLSTVPNGKPPGDPNPMLQLIQQIAFPLDAEVPVPTQYFAFTHRSQLRKDAGWDIYDPEQEYERQIRLYNHSQRKWTCFRGNKDFSICSSYPEILVQPYGFSAQEVAAVALHRSKQRLPTVTWIHPTNGAAFLRCSQPKQGLRSNKSLIEQKYFSLIHSDANPLIWIMDARPQINAVANRFKGAGYEDLEHYKEMVYTVRMKFLGIGNIHVMRESLRKLEKCCVDDTLKVEERRSLALTFCWFDHIRLLLKSARRIATTIHTNGQTVVLHCSDGWDRTSQLAALAQILMDGYFRTTKGFCVLIEKDWLAFGHKFADRTGQGSANCKCKERSPVFVQFIDCVWQLLQQSPEFFEFNEWLLLAILEHFTSARFGTFLYNTQRERVEYNLQKHTHSLWNLVLNRNCFLYLGYKAESWPEFLSIDPAAASFWGEYYLPA